VISFIYMRKQPLVTGEYYHLYNRGVDKRDIFESKEDMDRFIESMNEFNQINTVGSLRNQKKHQTAPKALSGSKELLVAFVVYCINPNHFHFVLKQLVDGGVSKFMQKLQAGYTNYFNAKHTRTGALFQGTFKSQIIQNENYFNKIIGYVSKNYQVHSIPKHKSNFVFASDYEYENGNFKIISREEGAKILEIFGGIKSFEGHCNEIVSIIRKERGETSLLAEDTIPDSPDSA